MGHRASKLNWSRNPQSMARVIIYHYVPVMLVQTISVPAPEQVPGPFSSLLWSPFSALTLYFSVVGFVTKRFWRKAVWLVTLFQILPYWHPHRVDGFWGRGNGSLVPDHQLTRPCSCQCHYAMEAAKEECPLVKAEMSWYCYQPDHLESGLRHDESSRPETTGGTADR